MHIFLPTDDFREAAERVHFRAEDFVPEKKITGTWRLPFSVIEQTKDAVEVLKLYNSQMVYCGYSP